MKANNTWEVKPIQQFSDYSKRWDELNNCTSNNLLISSKFVSSLLAQFSKGSEVIAICRSEDSDLAMGIFDRKKFGVWQTMQPSQAPIGMWLCNQNKFNEDIMKSLAESLPGLTLMISITQLDSGYYTNVQESSNFERLHYIDTSWIDIKGTFEEYWSERSKNTRQNLRRQMNKLDKEEVSTKLTHLELEEQTDDAVSNYGKLESKGWKAQKGTAIELNNAQGKFYSTILKVFYENKRGLTFQYYYDDLLVATDFCIYDDQCLIILKTTYDESQKTTSPAMLMHKEIFEYLFNCGLVRKIEFFGNIMEWHKKFTKNSRELFHINYFRWSWLKRFR